MPARPNQPDRSEQTEPARQDRPSGTAPPSSAGPLFRPNATTTGRPNRRWAGTRSAPAERSEGRRLAVSGDRSSPAGTYQRSPPPAKASSCSYSSSTARPRSNTEPASTGQESTPNSSHHRNACSTAQSIRSSVVPIERHLGVPEVRTTRTAAPRQPTGLTSFQQNADRPIRLFKRDESGRSSIRLTHACPHWAARRTSRPASLGTPSTCDSAATPKRFPPFVPL